MKKLLLFFAFTVFIFSCRKQSSDPYSLPDSYANASLGSAAHDMLSADKYTALSIEVHYMPGYQLDSAAVTKIITYLNSICNKPAGITVTQTQVGANSDTLNPSKVAALEKQYRTSYNTSQTLALHILVTDGYDTSVTTLGFAYRATSICLFGRDIFDHSGGFGQISRVNLEASVLEHELGHILGLVNLGSPMQAAHQDVTHGYHCTNTKCLMYYAIELHMGLGLNTTIPTLDSNCRKDLTANGGR